MCVILHCVSVVQTFRIKSLRSTRDGNKSAYDIVCHLINQRGKVCFRAEKVTRLAILFHATLQCLLLLPCSNSTVDQECSYCYCIDTASASCNQVLK
jgi:hypothetical protein